MGYGSGKHTIGSDVILLINDYELRKNYDDITPDVYKNYMKKKKAAERKGLKNGVSGREEEEREVVNIQLPFQDDKKSGKKVKDPVPNEDEIDEEDEVDSDDSVSNARSACEFIH